MVPTASPLLIALVTISLILSALNPIRLQGLTQLPKSEKTSAGADGTQKRLENKNIAYASLQSHPWSEITNKPDFSSIYQNNTNGATCAVDEFL